MAEKDSATQFLEPYLDEIRRAIVAGWAAWENLGNTAPQLRLPLSPRTRAAFVYDHIVRAARLSFSRLEGVNVSDQRGFLILSVGGKYIIRFKKLDKRGRSRQILTRQQRQWFAVNLQLPGMPPEAIKLIAGYKLDLLGTEIEQVLITKAVGYSVEWTFAITETTRVDTVTPMPTQTLEPKPGTVRSTRIEEKVQSDEESE